MTKIHIVGDGERDGATLPHLVGSLIGKTVVGDFTSWKEIRVGGYSRKLQFATRVARDTRCFGLLAAIDADVEPSGSRLKKLEEGRERDRATLAPFPTVIAEAQPHGEAWLLDDPVAVQRALSLPPKTSIPTVRKVGSPKAELDRLINSSYRSNEKRLDVLADIAKQVDYSRCAHCDETGFRKLQRELQEEFRELIRT
jgi:hypothetical protein